MSSHSWLAAQSNVLAHIITLVFQRPNWKMLQYIIKSVLCFIIYFLAWQEFNKTEKIGCFDYNEEFQYSFLNSRDNIYVHPANDLPMLGSTANTNWEFIM